MADFTSDFFLNNRKQLIAKTEADIIIVAGHGMLQKSSDEGFVFRQDSSFWYLTGLDEPDYTLVIDTKTGQTTLLTSSVMHYRDVFEGMLSDGDVLKISACNQVLRGRDADAYLREKAVNSSTIAVLQPMPPYLQTFGLYTNPARRRILNKIKRFAPKSKLIDIRMNMAQLRMIKQEPELIALQEAVDVTSKAFEVVRKNIQNLKHEHEIKALIEYEFSKDNYSTAYDSVCAAGKNVCTMHHGKSSAKLSNPDLILIDAGAQANHYMADVTRMLSIGKLKPRQLEVYEAVRDVHFRLLDSLKPGISLLEFHNQSDELIGKKLKKLGRPYTKEAIRQQYPHAISHYLGLDVHDAGDYRLPLEPGMVFTVEPGIYIQEEGVGARIEDDVVMTESGIKVLSKNIPYDLK